MTARQIFLLPGEVYVSREPLTFATLLGSCVAVCMFNRKHRFGGMNHYMLARTPAGEQPSCRHGDYSIEMLLRMMAKEDSNMGNIDATVIGGGNVIGHLSMGTGIGAHNIAVAKEVLERHNIRIHKTSIGGDFGRKIHFQNWDGQIDIRKIQKSSLVKDLEEKRKDLSQRKIKVLVVDDSALIRNLLEKAISSDPSLEVAATAGNAFEARSMLLEHDPDVITLDIIMPKVDGITFLRKLFQYKPKPVIVISTIAQQGSKIREQAKAIGAIDVIDKEELSLYSGIDRASSLLASRVKMAAAVYVKKKTAAELEQI